MSEQKTILLVEDNEELRGMLADQLSADGRFLVWQAATGTEGLAMMLGREARFDAVILDVNLPDGDGRDLCARLRRNGVMVPVIMLSANDTEGDVISGLEAGANDYVAKPFRLAELRARVCAQMRGFESSEDVAFRIGPYVFRPAVRLLQTPGVKRAIRLTDKEAAMLKFLYRANGEVVARQTLLQKVWGYHESVDSHTVETHIYRLRRKIEPDRDRIGLIVSEGGGYRLSINTEWEPPPAMHNGAAFRSMACA